MLEIALFFDVGSIFLSFGLMYALAAFFNRAWWHIIVVGIVVGIAVRALFFECRGYQAHCDGMYVAQVLIAWLHAGLAYLSMGLPEIKWTMPKVNLPRLHRPEAKCTEERLTELQVLRGKDLITADEYETSRKRIIDGV